MDVVFIAEYSSGFGLFECMDDVMPGILYARYPTLELAKEAAERRRSGRAGLNWDAPSVEEATYAEPLANMLGKGESFKLRLVLRGIEWPSKELRELPG